MGKSKKKVPDFFEKASLDPVTVATRGQRQTADGSSVEEKKTSGKETKKKAGFYLAASLIERFDRKFYELKLEGVAISNKSQLLEAALNLALDDLNRGKKSAIRKMLG